MRTYAEPKELVKNPNFRYQRQKSLAALSDVMLDASIIGLIRDFIQLPYCFTLQSCYGHFIYNEQNDTHNLEPLPITDAITRVEYRIAYVCICVENSDSGKELLGAMKKILSVDPKNVQFCCAEWFWKRQVNTYALQVQPERFKHKDRAVVDYKEALHIEKIRNEFFDRLRQLIQKKQKEL